MLGPSPKSIDGPRRMAKALTVRSPRHSRHNDCLRARPLYLPDRFPHRAKGLRPRIKMYWFVQQTSPASRTRFQAQRLTKNAIMPRGFPIGPGELAAIMLQAAREARHSFFSASVAFARDRRAAFLLRCSRRITCGNRDEFDNCLLAPSSLVSSHDHVVAVSTNSGNL